MPIDTTRVVGRRTLRFESLDDILRDLDALDGRPATTLGNWSQGQIFGHLARAFHGSIDGLKFTVPWYVRIVAGWFLRKRILNETPTPGIKLPREGQEQLVPPPMPPEEGLRELRAAIERFRRTRATGVSPILGPLTPEEWTKLMLRHCELHLSFIVPEPSAN